VEISQNFMAFSEYMNFNELLNLILLALFIFSETLRAYHQTSSDNNSDRDSRSTSSQRFAPSIGNNEAAMANFGRTDKSQIKKPHFSSTKIPIIFDSRNI
jgi:hypothetical protein